MMRLQIADYVLIVVLVIAVYSDLRFRKVWNWLTVSATIAGLALAWFASGVPGLTDSVKGLGLMLLVGLVGYFIGFIGAGDAKLLAGVGSLAGISSAAWVLAVSAVAGGVMALAVMAAEYGIKRGLGRIGKGFFRMAAVRSVYAGAVDEKRTRLPYSLAIAAAGISWIILRCTAAIK